AVLGIGAGTVTQQVLAQRQGAVSTKTAPRIDSKPSSAISLQQPKAEEKEMVVTGRVLDPDGKPVANARVVVLAQERRGAKRGARDEQLGLTTTDRDGQFRLPVRQTSSMSEYMLKVIGVAPGFGLGWQSFHPDIEHAEAVVML